MRRNNTMSTDTTTFAAALALATKRLERSQRGN